MDDWLLDATRGSQPQSTSVLFSLEVHDEVQKSWKGPFTAQSRFAAFYTLTTLDGGAARGLVKIPQVEHAIAVPTKCRHLAEAYTYPVQGL